MPEDTGDQSVRLDVIARATLCSGRCRFLRSLSDDLRREESEPPPGLTVGSPEHWSLAGVG